MLNPFQKSKLKIKRVNFLPSEDRPKPNIITVYEYLFPENTLKKTHRAMMGLCPIHGESNPSFAMYEDTNSYYCFSCQATGDSYKLIMEIEDCGFIEAIGIAESNKLYD